MANHHYGAHEVMELHDVLINTINSINTFHLYLNSVQDPALRQIITYQLQFMTDEYNKMVHFVHGLAAGNTSAYREHQPVNNGSNPLLKSNIQPNALNQPLDDAEIASCVLTIHKAGATMRMHAALECADQQIRHMILQGANNCAHQAYEIWSYMNSRGFYTVPMLQELSNRHLLRRYQSHPVTMPTVDVPGMTRTDADEVPASYSETVYSSGFEAPYQSQGEPHTT